VQVGSKRKILWFVVKAELRGKSRASEQMR